MAQNNADKRVEELKSIIAKHDYSYYVLANPEISDFEYDKLFKELQELEAGHPELVKSDSPTQRIGDVLTEGFKSVTHPFPLISLQNTYNEGELRDFHNRVVDGLGGNSPEYVCELKFDGVAVLLKYLGGVFTQAATRGDGEKGDDVTQNLRTIRSIPLKIYSKDLPLTISDEFYVRGEVYMDKKDFAQLNEERVARGDAPFANPRNSTAGSLKILDPNLVAKRPLAITTYAYDSPDQTIASHSECIKILTDLHFPVHKNWIIAKSLDEIIGFWKHWEEERDRLPFEIDGIVVKVNSLSDQKTLGMTARSPRWAIAFKFSARETQTRLNAILLQVGRTGIITPVAELEPVYLGGVTIKRATLHNFDEIKRLDIRIGDTVVLQRGGDVIPKIIGVDLNKRRASSMTYEIPTVCPNCGVKLEQDEGGVALRCPNPDDKEVIKRQIEHFASRNALDISGLGSETVELLVDKQLVSDPAELFFLDFNQLSNLERFGEKSAKKIIEGLEKAKAQSLDRFIFGLGIRFVGEGTAQILAVRFGSMDKIAEASIEDLESLPDIGPRVARSISEFFKVSRNKALIDKLKSAGITLTHLDYRPSSNRLSGMTFVITGTLKEMSREEIEKVIIAQGGKPTGSVTKKTSYLILGDNPGSKYTKAIELRIPIIGEKEFFKLIN